MNTFLQEEEKYLKEKGSHYTKEEWLFLKKKLEDISKYSQFDTVLEHYFEEIENETKAFLKTKSLTGISTSIAFDGCYINVLGGTSLHGDKVEEDTLFDVASITKLYTVLLTLLLGENHILSFDEPLSSIDPLFASFSSYTIEDLLYMRGEIRTKERIDEAKDKAEALRRLKTIYLHNSDKNVFVYSDIGMILLAYIIEKKMLKRIAVPLGYAGIMKILLLEPLSLQDTTFFPKGKIAGNGRLDDRIYDPKVRILGGISGSAGLYTNAHDLYFLSQELFSVAPFLPKKVLALLTEKVEERNKGIGGLYQKYPDLSRTYVPKEYSNCTFASEGSTGSVALFDMDYKLHNAILVDSVEINTGKKPIQFKEEYNRYQKEITDKTMELYLLEKYYGHVPYKTYTLKL